MEIINIIAILLSPVIAVCITLWYQNRKSIRSEKLNLFLTLMANRKTFPPPYSVVSALNTIKVLFHKDKAVLSYWDQYYDSLNLKAENVDWQKHYHLYLNMLDEMAKSLGYSLKQTDIDKFYTPNIYGQQYEMTQELQNELLRVLKGTGHFLVFAKDWYKKSDDNPGNMISESDNQNPVQK